MEVAIKKLTAFRLDSNLLDMLKSAAKREHRSLNNFVECLLTLAVNAKARVDVDWRPVYHRCR